MVERSDIELAEEVDVATAAAVLLKPWKYHDAASGNELEISISGLYTTLRVNERCYYFRTDSGQFEGTSTDLEIKASLGRLL